MGIPSPHFRRRRGGVEWRLSGVERHLVADLRSQLAQLLTTASIDGSAADDEVDAVRERLFPSAVTGDDEADAELRMLLHDELLAKRLTALDALEELLASAREAKDGGVRVLLDPDDCQVVLGVLNDVRLAIGARVGVTKVDRETLDAGDPRATGLEVMDYLGWMQEQLLAILVGPLDLDLEDL